MAKRTLSLSSPFAPGVREGLSPRRSGDHALTSHGHDAHTALGRGAQCHPAQVAQSHPSDEVVIT
eukprot:scaffold24644_cov63-Phaeocystis_antarctica.AAC.6